MTDISADHLARTGASPSLRKPFGTLLRAAGSAFYAALRAHRVRRAEQMLAEMSPHMLKDIGIGRSEIRHKRLSTIMKDEALALRAADVAA
jgi:uncharacterized protein YjiS (DUF1127 family)